MTRKTTHPKVVTANLLAEGDVVYLATGDRWVLDLADARLLNANDADQALARASSDDLTVVGAYLLDVTDAGDSPKPVHFREEFRASGPTNYAHGKAHGQRPGAH